MKRSRFIEDQIFSILKEAGGDESMKVMADSSRAVSAAGAIPWCTSEDSTEIRTPSSSLERAECLLNSAAKTYDPGN